MYFNYNSYQKAAVVNSSRIGVSHLLDIKSDVVSYFILKKENEVLAQENANLRSQLAYSLRQHNNEFFAIDDSLYKQQYKYLTANVINTSTTHSINYLTINRGKSDGIKKDMGVIAPNGIVGVIHHVSENFATVRTILDASNSPFQPNVILENSDYFGPLSWDKDDLKHNEIYLTNIPRHIKVSKNQKVFTKGTSTLFPSGIEVGKVDTVIYESGDNFHTIILKLNNNFKSISKVYVIDNLLKGEQIKLENLTEKSFK